MSTNKSSSEFSLENPVRVVTAASLFDGHDAAIQIMRRILQAQGGEIIHLGHDRAAHEVVKTAIEEDAQAIAVSSYQGGHMEYFTYMRELLDAADRKDVKIFGGGGGVIVQEEIDELAQSGTKIFSPEDGRVMGLVPMIQSVLTGSDYEPHPKPVSPKVGLTLQDRGDIARALTTIELEHAHDQRPFSAHVHQCRAQVENPPLIIGITGTGGAGKSSLIDELLLRYVDTFADKNIAVLSVDPSKKKTGGALLGDRIRMNTAMNERVFMRSMATRRANLATSAAVKDALNFLQCCQFDLIILETAGIGQSDSEVRNLCDIAVYIMTPEFGAPSQLEKIDMLDFADLVAINKFDKPGAEDALRDVKKTYQRNHELFEKPTDEMPVYGTSGHRFHDPGTNLFFNRLIQEVAAKDDHRTWNFTKLEEGEPKTQSLIPDNRIRYLGEIADTIREYHQQVEYDAKHSSKIQSLKTVLEDDSLDEEIQSALQKKLHDMSQTFSKDAVKALRQYQEFQEQYAGEKQSYQIRDKVIHIENTTQSLSHQAIPKVALPKLSADSDRIRFMMKENLPGYFPFTAGVFPFKRSGEDPTRMFAGEGTPERTNRRFHYVSEGQGATRLSTAFDSVTLYGQDPDLRPDIYGKVGNAGVSIATLDDAKRLYSGFNLTAPTTSVSMTINGPAPTVLAFFMNTAIDAEIEKRLKTDGQWDAVERKIEAYFKNKGQPRPTYRGELPDNHNGAGLGFLGLTADKVVDKDYYESVKAEVLSTVRGTVQADILKEDQAQNTCIFSTEFALRMMGDVQAYFTENNIRNFYSVSVSGYHIAEAGANPITQLAFTLANGFTLLEYYRSRGLDVDAVAKNFSFFFSNGLDPEYSVIGRVARRIWAIALRDLYGAGERAQKLKYHIQTSGRSLHAQEIAFNDIRTTLQALYAITDNCNSLHTNAYDEAITTPTEESVRRALAIQLVINKELGLTKNENPWQGSYFIEQLTDMVEEAVLKEFEALSRRGGVLGAMETMYQRGKIQEESMYYEHKKHSGELPIVGVNTFLPKDQEQMIAEVELMRSTEDEKQLQIDGLEASHTLNPAEREQAIQKLKDTARQGENLFGELMEAVKVCSLGEISSALFEVGGRYRRNM